MDIAIAPTGDKASVMPPSAPVRAPAPVPSSPRSGGASALAAAPPKAKTARPEPVLRGTYTATPPSSGGGAILTGSWGMDAAAFSSPGGVTEQWEQRFVRPSALLREQQQQPTPEPAPTFQRPLDGEYRGHFYMRTSEPPTKYLETTTLWFEEHARAPPGTGRYRVTGKGRNQFGRFWLEGEVRMGDGGALDLVKRYGELPKGRRPPKKQARRPGRRKNDGGGARADGAGAGAGAGSNGAAGDDDVDVPDSERAEEIAALHRPRARSSRARKQPKRFVEEEAPVTPVKLPEPLRRTKLLARQDSAEDFSRLDALLFTSVAWIFIPAYCFAIS